MLHILLNKQPKMKSSIENRAENFGSWTVEASKKLSLDVFQTPCNGLVKCIKYIRTQPALRCGGLRSALHLTFIKTH